RRRFRGRRPSHEPEAVPDQELTPERAEEDDSLHHADQPRREVGALEVEARVLEPAQKDRDQADGERVVAAEGGEDDSAVAEVRALQALWACVEDMGEVTHLAGAADPGDTARNRHYREDLPSRPHPGIAGGPLRVADHAHLEAEPCR